MLVHASPGCGLNTAHARTEITVPFFKRFLRAMETETDFALTALTDMAPACEGVQYATNNHVKHFLLCLAPSESIRCEIGYWPDQWLN